MDAIVQNKPYFTWIDHAKSLGILLMIAGHVWTIDPAIRQVIYAFHMPLFFVISGFLYRRVSLPERLIKDWRSLLVPYLIINIVCMLIRLSGEAFGDPHYDLIGHLIAKSKAIVTGVSLPLYGMEPVCGPSWFILAIFLLHLLFCFCPHEGRQRHLFMGVSSAVAILASYLLRRHSLDIPGPADAAIMAVPFFCLGGWLRELNWDRLRAGILIALCLGCTLMVALLNGTNGPVDMNVLDYGRNIFLFYFAAASGTVALFCLCMLIGRLRWKAVDGFARTMATGTILIVGFHRFGILAAEHLGLTGPIESLLVALGVWLVFFPIILLCRKWFPAILGYRS